MAWSRGTLLLPLLILTIKLWTAAAINTQICLPNIISDYSKKFPNIPNEFEGSYAWNSLSDNNTIFVREVFSEKLNLGIMLVEDLLGPGIQSKLYTYGDTNEFVYITDYDGRYGGDCVSGDLTADDFIFPFTKVSGQDHLVSGKDVLQMGVNEAAMLYLGTDTIDDIDVDVWNACLYDHSTDTTYNATYYFTLNATDGSRWRTSSGITSAIRRIHLIQNNGKGTNPSESTHEYYYFAGQLPPMTPDNLKYFEPPLGAYCPNRKIKKPLPQVGSYFSFYSEVFDPIANVITYTDGAAEHIILQVFLECSWLSSRVSLTRHAVTKMLQVGNKNFTLIKDSNEWYDFTSNMSRMDHNVLDDRSNLSRPIKIIHDYTTGLSYQIQMYSGTCKITPILADSFDNEIIPHSDGLLRMRTPKEFFDFDNVKQYEWVYEGTFVERGVECEVWISKRPYPTEDAKDIGYWEWYFTDTQWKMSVGDVLEDLEPFRLVVTVPKLNIKTEFNIYNFIQESPTDRYYDVSECFDQHKESRTYGFVMRANVAQYHLDTNTEMLKYWISFSLQVGILVRPLQLHNIQLEFDAQQVYVEFTILGAPKVQGDVEKPMFYFDLDTVEKALISAIKNKTLIIYYSEGNKELQFPVNKKSFCKIEKTGNKSVYYVISDEGNDLAQLKTIINEADVSPGGVAGIVISMLLVGVGIVAIPFVILTKKKKELASFNRSQLTMNEMTE